MLVLIIIIYIFYNILLLAYAKLLPLSYQIKGEKKSVWCPVQTEFFYLFQFVVEVFSSFALAFAAFLQRGQLTFQSGHLFRIKTSLIDTEQRTVCFMITYTGHVPQWVKEALGLFTFSHHSKEMIQVQIWMLAADKRSETFHLSPLIALTSSLCLVCATDYS